MDPAEQAVASVLFVHGGNGNREEVDFGAFDYYRALHGRRINVLTIDLRNHGASDKSATGYLTFGREEQYDARAGLDWLRAKSPGLRIFGSADSMGGSTLLYLAVAGGQFDGLVLVDPVLDNEDTITGSIRRDPGRASLDGCPDSMERSSSLAGAGRSGRCGQQLERADPLGAGRDRPRDPRRVCSRARPAEPERRLRVIGLEADDAVRLSTGGWGTHGSAFRRQPTRVLELVDRFLAARGK